MKHGIYFKIIQSGLGQSGQSTDEMRLATSWYLLKMGCKYEGVHSPVVSFCVCCDFSLVK